MVLKVRKYENKYRTKICDFALNCSMFHFLLQKVLCRGNVNCAGFLEIPRKLFIHWHHSGTSGEEAIAFLNTRVRGMSGLRTTPEICQRYRKKITKIAGEFKKVQGSQPRIDFLDGMTKIFLQEDEIKPVGDVIDETRKDAEAAWKQKCAEKDMEAAKS